jgi:hypothetical protein
MTIRHTAIENAIPLEVCDYIKKFFDERTDLHVWKENNPNRTVAQELAWNAAYKARTELKYLVEVTDRTEGKPTQTVNMTVADVSAELDELESNYDELGSKAEGHMVAVVASLQNKE